MHFTDNSSTKKSNNQAFSLYFHSVSVISSKKFHCLCIIIEYIPILFSSFSCAQRIKFFGSSEGENAYVGFDFSGCNPFSIVKHIDKSIQIIVFSAVAVLSLILLAMYFITDLIPFKEFGKNKFLIAIRNIYDIVFFRYLSGYILFSLVQLCKILYFENNSLCTFFCVVTILVVIFYAVSSYFFIRSHSTYFQINNKDISKNSLEYPFDSHFSRQYDIQILVLKIFDSFEASFFEKFGDQNKNILMIQLCIVIIHYIVCFYHIFSIFSKDPFLTGFIINKELNYLRYTLILNNSFYLVYILFFDRSHEKFQIIVVGVLTVLIGVATSFHSFTYIGEKNKNNFTISIPQLLYLLTHKNKIAKAFVENRSELFNNILKEPKPPDKDSLVYINSMRKYIKSHWKNRPNEFQCYNSFLVNNFYQKLFKLFYYHLKNKSYKFYGLYDRLTKEPVDEFRAQYAYAYKICIEKSYDDEEDAEIAIDNEYKNIFKCSIITEKVSKVLLDLQDLIKKNDELRFPSLFFSLSDSLFRLKTELNQIVLGRAQLLFSGKQKVITNLEKYTNIILRFIFEKLTGLNLGEGSKLNVEIFEDFLSFHFYEDKFLIMTEGRFDKKKENYPIIKCGGELTMLKKKECFLDLIPKEYRKGAVENLALAIKEFDKRKKDAVLETMIKSPENEEYFEYLNFNLKVSSQLIENKAIIFCVHKPILTTKSLVFRKEQDTFFLLNFSFSCFKLFGVSPTELSQLYQRFPLLKKRKKFFFSSFTKPTPSVEEYELSFNSKKFNKKLSKLFEDYNLTDSPLLNLVKSPKVNCKIKIKKGFSILNKQNNYDEVYLVDDIFHLDTNKQITEETAKQEAASEFIDGNLISTGSMSSVSMGSSQKIEEIKKTNLGRSDNEKLKSLFFTKTEGQRFKFMLKKYFFIFFLTTLLNVFSIVLFVIFFIIQIRNSSKLIKINLLYYELKNFRVQLENTFLTVISNICLSQLNEEGCVNFYETFSKSMIDSGKVSPEFNIGRYVMTEMPYKLSLLKDNLNNLTTDLYNYGNQEYIALLDTEMDFYSITYNEGLNQLSSTKKIINFEDGLKEFMNSILVLANYEKLYDTLPIHIISNNGDEVDFSNVEVQSISFEQINIYLILINYGNFYHIMFHGDYMLLEETEIIITINKTYMIIFIIFTVCIIVASFVLLFFCIMEFNKVAKYLILRIKRVIKNEPFMKFFEEKLENLITLSQLYNTLPTTSFDKIKANEKEFKRYLKAELAKMAKFPTLQKSVNSKTQELFLPEHLAEIFYHSFNYLRKIIIFYFLFLCFSIGYSIALESEVSHFVHLDDFVYYYPAFENDMYSILVIPQMLSRLNMTDDDVEELLGNEDSEDYKYEDAYTNSIARMARDNYDNMTRLHKTSGFPKFSEFFPQNTCESIFSSLSDPVTSEVESNSNINNINQLLVQLCEYYKVTINDNFYFLYDDYLTRAQRLINTMDEKDYTSLYNYIHQKEIYELISLSLLVFRPISYTIRKVYLNPGVRIEMTFVKKLVIMYLFCNITFSIALFILVKKTVIEKLNDKIKKLFFLNSILWI